VGPARAAVTGAPALDLPLPVDLAREIEHLWVLVIEGDPARVLRLGAVRVDEAAGESHEVIFPVAAGPARVVVVVVGRGAEDRVGDQRPPRRVEGHVVNPGPEVSLGDVIDDIRLVRSERQLGHGADVPAIGPRPRPVAIARVVDAGGQIARMPVRERDMDPVVTVAGDLDVWPLTGDPNQRPGRRPAQPVHRGRERRLPIPAAPEQMDSPALARQLDRVRIREAKVSGCVRRQRRLRSPRSHVLGCVRQAVIQVRPVVGRVEHLQAPVSTQQESRAAVIIDPETTPQDRHRPAARVVIVRRDAHVARRVQPTDVRAPVRAGVKHRTRIREPTPGPSPDLDHPATIFTNHRTTTSPRPTKTPATQT
jgi:hypothetical protein